MVKIIPKKKQLKFLSWEMGVFFHFGIRTFCEGHKDWDGIEMPVKEFNPADLDCEQWTQTIKAGGAKYAILTCKHHDGFANWPSKYTEYSIKNSHWENGEGDVVREFVNACRKCDLKVGLYYSPAQYGSHAMQGKEYDDYFINQISELLTDYGKIDYLWFDGCGSENHKYDEDRIIATIRGLQSEILIFSMWDPDTRWIGNEEGIAPLGSRNTVISAKTSIMEKVATQLDTHKFLPFECDCKIRRKNWFYSDNDLPLLRSLDDLMGLYYYSVGRGGNLLINIAPDRSGHLPKEDGQRYMEFGNEIKRRFLNPLPYEIIVEDNILKLKLNNPQMINHIVLKENLQQGESVEEFKISTFYHVEMPLIEGKTIGHKQICSFPSIYTEEIHIEITKSNGDFKFDNIELFYVR